MSRWQRERLALNITSRYLVWRHEGTPDLHRHPLDLGDVGSDGGAWPAVAKALQAVAPSWGDARVDTVMLSDGWLRYWLMQAPDGIGTLSVLRAVAGARLQQVYGLKPEHWHVLGDWHARKPFVCAAVPQKLIDVITETLGPGLLVVPEFTAVFADVARHLGQSRWACLQTSGQCFVMGLEQGGLQSLRVLAHASAGATSLPRVAAELRRESLRTGRPIDGPVAWLGWPAKSVAGFEIDGVPFVQLPGPDGFTPWRAAGPGLPNNLSLQTEMLGEQAR